MKKCIWWILFLFSCTEPSGKVDTTLPNTDTIPDTVSSPPLNEIKDALISFSCTEIRGVGSSNLKTYRQWPTDNYTITQNVDTLTVKFNKLNGSADWFGNVIIKGDSLHLLYDADPETMVKMLCYYEFIYKVKNPEKKQFKIRNVYADKY